MAGTLPWFDRSWLIPTVGLFEVAIGFGIIIGRYLGTFLFDYEPSITIPTVRTLRE